MKHYKPSDPFYHSEAWKKARKAALVRDGGMCQDCMARFRAGYGKKPRRADMVHHILSRETRPDLELCLENLISLCSECHNKRHPEKGEQAKQVTAGKTRMRIIKM